MGTHKADFERDLKDFVATLREGVSTPEGEWTIKGFIDVFKNVYTISGDTKIVSKILEIHLFPMLLKFAEDKGYKLVLADHQNYYPDMTFVSCDDESRKFALDLKTTYRIPNNPENCNGFTIGSHGQYFIDRNSRKNIQFPYSEYSGHFCLGVLYDRVAKGDLDETRKYALEDLESITSVISNMQFFVAEKWKIASDRSGSGNTANIGSIRHIEDLLAGRGVFSELGEHWFDDYWMNYGKITVPTGDGGTKKITGIESFVEYRGGDLSKIVKRKGGKRIRVEKDGRSSY